MMLVLVLPLIACSSSIPIYDAENVPLAAVFAGWYGHDPVSGECIGGLGSTHWNDGPNTGGVRYVPEMGYYCSSDPKVVSWQLDQMEEAGISFLLSSWWGWGDGGGVRGNPGDVEGVGLAFPCSAGACSREGAPDWSDQKAQVV